MMLSALLLAVQTATPIHPVTLKTPEGAREPQVSVQPILTGIPDPPIGRFGGTESDPVAVHVVFGTKNAIYVSSSRDRAGSFFDPVRVANVGSLALGMRRGPRIAASGPWVVVTAIAGERGGGRDGDLLCWRSEDYGLSWNPAGRINSKEGSAREGLHAMAAGPKGAIFCAWIDLDGDAPRICGALSKDAGGSWGTPVVVQGDSTAICPCCHPSVAIDANGAVAVMWRGQENGARDMVVARSENGGTTFSSPAKIGSGTWKLDACPMDGGALVSTLGRTLSVWRRQDKIYRAEMTGDEVSLGDGEQPWIAMGPVGLCVVWLRKRGGPLLLWWKGRDLPLEIDSAANDPVVASPESHSGPVIAAWESGAGDHTRIVAARIGGPPPAK
jgi:hypothetical protein